ncbi:MAG: lytic transglycosylase F [bacterium]|nr:lytic transglycosylase F [bacterium]
MHRLFHLTALALLACCAACGSSPPANAPAEEPVPIPAAEPSQQLLSALDELPPGIGRLLQPWQGDLDAMIERRLIRVLTVFNPMSYYLDGAAQRGVVSEAVLEFERRLNHKLDLRSLRVNVVIVPVTRDMLIPALIEGRGDIAAANLTITPERLEQVDFTQPLLDGVDEVLVEGPSAAPLATLRDLAGREMHLRRSSSYWDSVERLNRSLEANGAEPVRLVPASEWVEDGGLLELVDGGALPWTVVDSHKARFWSQFYANLRVREDLTLRTDGKIGWAIRKNSPRLAAELDAFVRDHRKGTLFGNVVYKRYLEKRRPLGDALHPENQLRFLEMADLFRKYGQRYGLDWLLLAAQAYQESGLDNTQRSRRGAVGVMQVLPATARSIDVANYRELEGNIHAGAKYMRLIMDRYFDDETLEFEQRRMFALAAYNAGPTRVRRLRRRAADAGFDPDLWFGNVEVMAARQVGAEPVRYVSNIVKYYVVYRMLEERARLEGSATH